MSSTSPPPATTSSKASLSSRNRENQRLSRARRKDYIASLETRVREYERQGAQATVEMQKAAREVMEENKRLKELLAATMSPGANEHAMCPGCAVGNATPRIGSVSASSQVRGVKRKMDSAANGSLELLANVSSDEHRTLDEDAFGMAIATPAMPKIKTPVPMSSPSAQQFQSTTVPSSLPNSVQPSELSATRSCKSSTCKPRDSPQELRAKFQLSAQSPMNISSASLSYPPVSTQQSMTMNAPSSCCSGSVVCTIPTPSSAELLTPQQQQMQADTTSMNYYTAISSASTNITTTNSCGEGDNLGRPSNPDVLPDTTDCHDAVALFSNSDPQEIRNLLCSPGLAGQEFHCRIDNKTLFRVLDEVSR